jgi:hypothetical protein
MGLLDFPNPVEWITGAKDDSEKRALINATMSALYSAQITLLWETGKAAEGKWWGSEGPALKRTATAIYLTLSVLEQKNLIALTVPKDLLDPNNLSQFQTERMTK